MSVNLSPKKGHENCTECNEKISFAMFPHPIDELNFISTLLETNAIVKQSKMRGWICWNCAFEKEWTNESSLEGATTWCISCEEILDYEDGNNCLNCGNPDFVYCLDCWIKEVWEGNGDGADEHDMYHPECVPE